MAGGSEKKRAKSVVEYRKLYTKVFAILYGFFILYRVVWHWSSFFFGNWLMLFLFTAVNYFCFFISLDGISNGQDKSMPEDVMLVNCFIMFLSAFWETAWVIYFVIPIYAIASKMGCLSGGKDTPVEEAVPQLSPELLAEMERKKKKKEKKAERPKFKRVR